MVDYTKMTDAEIKKYREKSRKETKQRQEEWKKEHPNVNGVYSSCSTPFDDVHHIPYPVTNTI